MHHIMHKEHTNLPLHMSVYTRARWPAVEIEDGGSSTSGQTMKRTFSKLHPRNVVYWSLFFFVFSVDIIIWVFDEFLEVCPRTWVGGNVENGFSREFPPRSQLETKYGHPGNSFFRRGRDKTCLISTPPRQWRLRISLSFPRTLNSRLVRLEAKTIDSYA